MDDPWVMTVQKSAAPDLAEVARALRILADPAHYVQVQALPSGRWRQVPGGDVGRLADAVADLADEKGVYLTLNPFAGPVDHAVRSSDILSRRWLLVDPDAVKGDGGDGGKDRSTTDREKDAALRVAEAIRAWLTGIGWPEPVFVDSGNNWQLLYRVDLPNDKLAQQLTRGALKALAARFDTDRVKVDRAVHDAKRICKIPGTWVRKGDNTDERPWRMARLIAVPDPIGVVSAEQLRDLAATAKETPKPEPPPVAPPDPWTMTVGMGGDAHAAYARSALEKECHIVATATAPGRNATLYEAALKLGSLVGAGLLDEAEVRGRLAASARECGLGSDGDPKEVDRAIENGFKVGVQTPREIPDRKATTNGGGAAEPPPMGPDDPMVIQASRVIPKNVDWLWRDRVPKGFITIFAGRTGLGKSFVTSDIAARVTRGDCWPDSNGECTEPGNVLIISEDPFEYVLTPRLIEMEADLNRVFYMSWEAMARYQLDDTDMLGRAAALAGNPALVVIDPPTNFLGSRDEHKNSEVRAVLMRLVTWLKAQAAQGRHVAIILITHVSKAAKGIEAINRVIGSVAWTSTSRIAHSFSPDPDDPARCLFVPMKNNLGPLAKGLSYRIAVTETFARVEWLGTVDTTADQAMDRDATPRKDRAEVASEWLLNRFAERLEWLSDDLFAAAERDGIGRNSIFKAKDALRLPRARKTKLPDGTFAFLWRGPEGMPEAADTNGHANNGRDRGGDAMSDNDFF